MVATNLYDHQMVFLSDGRIVDLNDEKYVLLPRDRDEIIDLDAELPDKKISPADSYANDMKKAIDEYGLKQYQWLISDAIDKVLEFNKRNGLERGAKSGYERCQNVSNTHFRGRIADKAKESRRAAETALRQLDVWGSKFGIATLTDGYSFSDLSGMLKNENRRRRWRSLIGRTKKPLGIEELEAFHQAKERLKKRR